ncbi:MAG: alpha/beta hydrolase [Gemmatimonadota bacterium]|nr:MAG: alpha/beta hydrolase [Gemmatimonadota bacterium]
MLKTPVKNLRTYGQKPFTVAVVHGGPGAPGHMIPVARELSSEWGVLEPLQTETSVQGQIEELKNVLEEKGDFPMTVIGFSWGAWLSYLCAAHYPALVKKLILIGSGPFKEKYATAIQEIRLNRLSEDEKNEALSLTENLKDPAIRDKDAIFARLGKLFTKADAFDPSTLETEDLEVRYRVYRGVWNDAAELRRSGELLKLGRRIRCPVVAIHGIYDPHPAEGVRKPLSAVLTGFRFMLLENCGHMPWIERQAREEFYKILKEELC